MQVELLVSRAGPRGANQAGERIEVAPDEARRMIAAGQAVPVRTRKTEQAVRDTVPEKAVR